MLDQASNCTHRSCADARGFSLIELLVVVALFSIIVTISVGSYRDYVRRANRTDATSLLLRVAAAQERFYLDENRYALDADLADLGFGNRKSEHGYYDLAIAPGPSGDPAIDFTATATVVGNQSQADDTDCVLFSITESGVRDSQPEPPDTCWD
ncbi:MAG: prepilin-type N-terminal cleavage/methylation domain-containing protein [Gammaproteobacteria bacterium]|nr:prepilin-type N-terminal cleavage/methylation domain-containing protein [Gammaproteobacteria bacterium]NND35925.1 prepilin-type N-terminal cleavage/methylation domain-containing protein [Gammaproteobacteria bacterium]